MKRLFKVFIVFFVITSFIPLISRAQSPDELKALSEQYRQLDREGRHREAIPVAQKLLAIHEKKDGPDHPAVAASLNNLGEQYRKTGDYEKAEPLFHRAVAIYEKAYGPDHPSTAIAYNNLAGLHMAMGEYTKTEDLLKKVLGIYERSRGPNHVDTARALNNLALLYSNTGEYAKAQPLITRSLAIVEKTYGPGHPVISTVVGNLAELYAAMGDYQRALSLMKRSLAIAEKAYGPDHPDIARSLNNLAFVYFTMKQFKAAEPLYRRSLDIMEKSLGPEHPNTATTLNNLSVFYGVSGDYDKAVSFGKRSLAIRQKVLGPDHPVTATSLNNLATIYVTMGDYRGAEPFLERSLTIIEKTLGPDHPNMVLCLNNMGVVYAATGRQKQALPLFLRAQEIEGGLIDQVMGFTSEEQKMKFLETREKNLYGFLNFVSQFMSGDQGVRRRALTIWLQRKGTMLEAQKRFQDALVFSDDPRIAQKFQELARVRSRLSRLIFSGSGGEGPEARRQKIAELEQRKEQLEAELSRLSDAFARTRRIAKADSGQVAGALPAGSVLIDFVKLPVVDFHAVGTKKKWGPPRYYAFVLPSGRPDRVSFIDLGSADKIDRLIGEFKKNIVNYQADPAGKEASRISRRLYEDIFRPLEKEIAGIKDIYVSPDGNLNLIPFEILKGPDGRYLIEDRSFNYLGTGRDILGFGMVKTKSSPPLIMGDPDYDLDEAELKASLEKLGIAPGRHRFVATRSRDMSSKEFPPLPGTREEVESIISLLGKKGSSLYTGKEALEDVLMRCANPGILHLATHGFFLTDQDMLDEDRKESYENPLVRSGIVLAGANRSMRSGSDEGLITAEKILSLRLHGTDLVVLSACETGLGDIKSGEGVFGLRRAFTQAGAKGLVMSMWSVPDRETKELMINFYTNILVNRMKRSEALRQAILSELSQVRKRYGNTNPFFWGAFIYMGEP